jgi:hypothetical protein
MSDLLAAADAAARERRLAELYRRGLAAAQRAVANRQFPDIQGAEMQERIIIGSPLVLAHALLREGDAASIEQACEIVESVLATQERHPAHPHRGNWPRVEGAEEVEDLNSAPFVMRWLLPPLFEHGERLPADLRLRCDECIRLALAEIERMNVSDIYTNIALKSAYSLIVGGEMLGDQHFQQLGKQRWRRWLDFTIRSGAPREYNSPKYMGFNFTTLAKLAQMTTDDAVRLEARLIAERFWLHAVMHLHRPTRQLAGPHARSYWPALTTGRDLLNEILWRETGWMWPIEPGPFEDGATVLPVSLELALTEYTLPDFAPAWLERQEQAFPYEVRENASAAEGHDLTTYHSRSFALGTASRTYSTGTEIMAIEQMANHLILHYARPGAPGDWGLMYSRYVVNDQHWGTLRTAPYRHGTNFFDQGNFAGVQARNKAIALYALLPLGDAYVTSLKTIVAFPVGDAIERVWINDRQVGLSEPLDSLRQGDWLIVEDGAVLIGVYPLEPTCLGREAPLVLERGPLGELWLSLYNYRGSAKRLWDYNSLGGAFWRGNLRAGFVVEVAERADYASAAAFLADLRRAVIEDGVDDFIRTVTYRHGDDELSLRYDLWNTEPRQRRFNGVAYEPPALSSPLGVQGDGGELRVGSARLVTEPRPVWLIAQEVDPARRTWIAVNPQDYPTPVRLETPCGVVSAGRWGMGRLEWRAPVGGSQELIVDALTEPVGLRVPDGVTVRRRPRDA